MPDTGYFSAYTVVNNNIVSVDDTNTNTLRKSFRVVLDALSGGWKSWTGSSVPIQNIFAAAMDAAKQIQKIVKSDTVAWPTNCSADLPQNIANVPDKQIICIVLFVALLEIRSQPDIKIGDACRHTELIKPNIPSVTA